MKFKYPVENPTTIIELPGAELPLNNSINPQQKRDFTLGGTPYVYDRGWKKIVYHIKLRVNKTDKEALENFFEIIEWSKKEFLWEMNGFLYPKVVRLWSELKIKWRTPNIFEVAFDLLFIRDEVLA